jgi:hypothetical protein
VRDGRGRWVGYMKRREKESVGTRVESHDRVVMIEDI